MSAEVPILVVATSARLIAEGLAAAGCATHVIDCFGDADCRAVAQFFERVDCAAANDFDPAPEAVLAAVGRCLRRHPGGRVVTGGGFEGSPEVLTALARQLPVLGNPGAVVAACKDPWQFARACAALGLRTPALAPAGINADAAAGPCRDTPTGDRAGSPDAGAAGDSTVWLHKRVGASGGGHVTRAAGKPQAGAAKSIFRPLHYLQREVPGVAVSLLFLAEATGIRAVSVQRQYPAPGSGAPFRFGGLVAAPDLALRPGHELAAAAAGLARWFGLRGLNGLDAMWDDGRLWLLEINPRPPASLALRTGPERARLLQAHMTVCAEGIELSENSDFQARQGSVPAHSLMQSNSPRWWPQRLRNESLNPGMALVYASRSLSIPADFRFPPGCHDRPTLPRSFAAGEPVCSLRVSEGGVEKLRALTGALRERLLPVAGAEILSSL